MYLQVIPGLSSKSFSSVAPQLQQDQEFDARYVEYFNRSHTFMYSINNSSKSLHTKGLAPITKLKKLQDGNLTGNFNRADIDGWEVRKGMADLCAMDLVPEPM